MGFHSLSVPGRERTLIGPAHLDNDLEDLKKKKKSALDWVMLIKQGF